MLEPLNRCDGCPYDDDVALCPQGDFCRAELEDQIQKVRELRAELESKTQELHEQQVAFNQQHAALIEAKCKAASDCTEAEARLRHMTLAAYHETGNKKPADGVGIRISKLLQYDEDFAKHWAITNGHIMFLQLDRVGFEAWYKAFKAKRGFSKSMKESGLAVLEVEQAQPTIAREL